MELTGIKPCIISAGIGGWYSVGVERLERSLIMHGYAGDYILWKNEYPPNSPRHEDNPYAFKIYAFEEAFRRGYKNVMWLDSSFWCIKQPHGLFDIINDYGVFGFRSGYNCSNTCPDNLLAAAGITRDEAEKIPETATGIVGLNIDNPDGKNVYDIWKSYCENGLFINSRTHNPEESSDYRYKHGRQDQSAWSIALYKAGVEFNYVDYVAYYNGGNPGYNPDRCYFFIGGL